MPEFILESSGLVDMDRLSRPEGAHPNWLGVALRFEDLDPFTQGYIEALFFTSEGPQVSTERFLTPEYQEDLRQGRADGTLPGDVGFADLHPKALESIIADCKAFQERAADLLETACSRTEPENPGGCTSLGHPAYAYDRKCAGRDFWFTRNGHGVGFWDRRALEADDLGEQLSELASEFGESNAFFGNDCIEPDSLVHVD